METLKNSRLLVLDSNRLEVLENKSPSKMKQHSRQTIVCQVYLKCCKCAKALGHFSNLMKCFWTQALNTEPEPQ